MIKKILAAGLMVAACFNASAQHYYREGERSSQQQEQQEETYGDGFKREHMFIGGDLGLGYSSYSFNAGISPELGYSLRSWLDVGVLVNLNYASVRADPYYNDNTRQRSFNYGAGAFVSVYPLPFLFLQVRPEYNWIQYTQTYYNNTPTTSSSFTTKAPSLLVGIGYGQRIVGKSKMNLTLMIDLLNGNQSPYRDFYGTIIPVLKAGFDIYFHPKKH